MDCESKDVNPQSIEGSEDVEEKTISVIGEPRRTPLSHFVNNKGLKAALLSATDSVRCQKRDAHDVLDCDQLHDLDVVVKLDSFTYVRLKALVYNAAMRELLMSPDSSHRICKSKKKHDIETCSGLHFQSDVFPVGKERVQYLASEALHTAAYRHLLANPKHHGRWCTNVLKHDPHACTFLHRSPRRGETLGKTHCNLDPLTGRFDTTLKYLFDVPGLSKTRKSRNIEKDAALQELVNKINAAEEDDPDTAQVDGLASQTPTPNVELTQSRSPPSSLVQKRSDALASATKLPINEKAGSPQSLANLCHSPLSLAFAFGLLIAFAISLSSEFLSLSSAQL